MKLIRARRCISVPLIQTLIRPPVQWQPLAPFPMFIGSFSFSVSLFPFSLPFSFRLRHTCTPSDPCNLFTSYSPFFFVVSSSAPSAYVLPSPSVWMSLLYSSVCPCPPISFVSMSQFRRRPHGWDGLLRLQGRPDRADLLPRPPGFKLVTYSL